MSAAASRYVYGILAASARVPSRTGIGDAPLELVASDGIAALVSDVPAGDLRMGRDAMTAHARVLEQAHSAGTVLPMRFGVVMAGDSAIQTELLDPHRDELVAQLAEFEGKAELKLRGTYEEDALLREVVREDQDIARLRESLRGAPEDATYYGRIQLGELIARAIERKREVDGREMLEPLTPLALAVDIAEPTHERVVLSASFLVEEGRIEEFDEEVDLIGRAQADRIRLKYTGPLPPHSFVHFAAEV